MCKIDHFVSAYERFRVMFVTMKHDLDYLAFCCHFSYAGDCTDSLQVIPTGKDGVRFK